MQKIITFAVVRSLEGGYEARALGHSIFTAADTVEKLRHMIADAVRCHFDDDDRPASIRLVFTWLRPDESGPTRWRGL